MMFRYTTPKFIKLLFPSLIWELPNNANKIYLTFDDGPHPRITQLVLDILKTNQAKATFFCVGDNVSKYPEMAKQIISDGHSIGNHTFHHVKGWDTPTAEYVDEVKSCDSLMATKLFRPPYGRITPKQIRVLSEQYQIVMWDILTRDYEADLSIVKAFEAFTKAIKSGSIIVMHDSEKAEKQMLTLLPMILEYGRKQGFIFDAIPS
jgi:peptidoglycan/xylan/chitin deacetylase (PgdA/CDA1 family)